MSMNLSQTNIPKHLGIIMDGNGRWAEQRGLPRIAGHQQGLQAVFWSMPVLWPDFRKEHRQEAIVICAKQIMDYNYGA